MFDEQPDYRQDKITDVLKSAAADFVSHESNRKSMITVTRAILGNDFRSVTFFVTVFPENQEKAVIDFLRRQRSACKNYIKKNTKVVRIPMVDFVLDTGEKSKQRIDEITKDLGLDSDTDPETAE